MNRTLPFAIATGFYALVLLGSFHEADEDLWGRMAVGRLILSEGQVPKEDVFAYVPTKPLWVDHEWFSGVVFHQVHRRFGGSGLLALRALVGCGAVALLLLASRSSSPWTPAFFAVAVWPLVGVGFNSVVRAQAFTFLFFAATLFLLERGRPLLALLPLTALWANLHGGFVIGPLLVLAYAGEAVFRREPRRALSLGALALGAFTASLLNPYGLAYWSYLADALAMARPEIVEWRAATPADFQIGLALSLSLLLVAARPPRPAHLVALAGAATATLLHLRFAPLLGMVMVVTLPGSWELVFSRRRSWIALPAMVLALFLLFVGIAVSWLKRDLSFAMRVPEDRYPVLAVEHLRQEAPGNVAVFFNWGEYVLYHLHETHLVSIDGRYETVYPEDVVEANWRLTRGLEGSETFLDEYPADFALFPRESGAARLLARTSGFRILHEGEHSLLFSRER